MLCGQFDILYASLKNLSYAAKCENSKKTDWLREKQKKFDVEDQELNQYFMSIEKFDTPNEGSNQSTLNERLKDCVKHHQMILEFATLVQDFFGWFVFSKMIYSGLKVLRFYSSQI